MRFEDFMAEVEAEAHADGPRAVAELEAFRRVFAEERRLLARLARVIRPAFVHLWLDNPNPLLDGDTPLQRIAAGDSRSVERLVSGLVEDLGAS